MIIKPVYKVSLLINTILSILFIAVIIFGIFEIPSADSPTIIIAVLIILSYACFLLFNFICYSLSKANNENRLATNRIINYRKLIFLFTILAILITAFMCLAATFSFITEHQQFSKKQQPFYIIFLLLLLISFISGILNTVFYRKAFKYNQSIVNAAINAIGNNN